MINYERRKAVVCLQYKDFSKHYTLYSLYIKKLKQPGARLVFGEDIRRMKQDWNEKGEETNCEK